MLLDGKPVSEWFMGANFFPNYALDHHGYLNVGYMVIWNVTPALHTPLMSVTNAISSIIVIGALLQVSSTNTLIMWIAVLTVLITSINIAGGFAVTRRMLDMFRK